MRRQTWLGLAFLGPALIFVLALFLAPVVMTGFFAFTNMSTATGITGGTYRISETVLSDLANREALDGELIARLGQQVYAVDEAGLDNLAASGAEAPFVDEIRADLSGQIFTDRPEFEDALKDLDNRPRSFRNIRAAAEHFERSVLNADFDVEADFEAAIVTFTGPLDAAALATLSDAAYSGWTMTSANFSRLANAPELGRIILNTAFYVGVTVTVFNTGYALFLAIATFYLPVGQAAFFRGLWLLPRISPPVLYVLLWKWLAWDTGFISSLLEPLGVSPRNWMFDSTASAWAFVVMINGFVGASMGMIIFSSAIRAIPAQILYASEVDGASRWQQIRHIVLPQLRWPLLFITAYQTLSLLTSFEYILLSTDGGPGSTTEVWALAAYHAALSNYAGNLQYGYGAAMALFLVFVGIGLSLIYLRLFNFDKLLARPRIEQ